MHCPTIVSLVGSRIDSDPPLTSHQDNDEPAFKKVFREVVLRVLDGFYLQKVKYSLEPWHNTFFYQPEEILTFMAEVDHPSLGFHLDQMNMVNQQKYFQTTCLINHTFDLLSCYICSVHLKDVRCDPGYMFLKYDEVLIGDGILDYHSLLKRLSQLPEDLPCFCEHLADQQDYLTNFSRLQHLAQQGGFQFKRRTSHQQEIRLLLRYLKT